MTPFTRYEILITVLFAVLFALNVWNSLRRIRALCERFQAQSRAERKTYESNLAKMDSCYNEQSAAMQAQYEKSLSGLRTSFDRSLGVVASAAKGSKPS